MLKNPFRTTVSSLNGGVNMTGGRITKESMEMLLEEIVDAVESSVDRDIQFDMVSSILVGNGIVEIIED